MNIEWGVLVRGIENSIGDPLNVTFCSSHIGNIFGHEGYPYEELDALYCTMTLARLYI